MSEVTRLLDALDRGEPRAAEELLPLVYEELRRLAHLKMAQEKPGQTLQPTALVHEAWLRLTQTQACTWANRRHFFGAAAEAMRRILVERAVQLSWPAVAGAWVVEGARNAEGPWNPVAEPVTAKGGLQQMTIPAQLAEVLRVFRLRQSN